MEWIYCPFSMYFICFMMIAFTAAQNDGDVQLIGGTSSAVGGLQVYYKSGWGAVCDGPTLRNIAQVACHSLQREFVTVNGSYFSSYYMSEMGRINVDVSCDGAETNLAQCSHSDLDVNNCGRNEYIWVQCSGHIFKTVPGAATSTKYSTTSATTASTISTTTTSPVCVSRNKTLYLRNGATTADIELEPGRVITMPAVDSVYKTGQGCELYISVIADHRILRRLVFKAVYDIQCSLISDEMSRKIMSSSAQQHFQVISGICRQDCSLAVSASAEVACVNDHLSIEWPTEKTFREDMLTDAADLVQRLNSRQGDSLPILPVVVLSKLPPVIYPMPTAENGYVEASLTASCIDNSVYDAMSDTCVSK